MPPVPAPDPGRTDSYLICATPRTGSSLLCGLLDSTGVAGHPESWFRRQGQREFAVGWGIADPSDGTFGYASYFQAAVAAGSTANGVFAARIMWGTMDEVTAHLAPVYPGHAGSAAGLLNAAFGRTRFVYLRRGDVVAQAVSLLRAEQTGVWFETADERQEPAAEPGFDFAQVRELVRQIEEDNAAWEAWFAAGGASSPTGCFTRTLTTIPSASPPACSAPWDLTCLRAARSPSGTSASRTISTLSGSQATTFTRRESGHSPDARRRQARQSPSPWVFRWPVSVVVAHLHRVPVRRAAGRRDASHALCQAR